jgi:ubiquinone/menaquinone biosynthesis C-methylase UbiE
MPRVDYDTIADVYDRDAYRARTFDPQLAAYVEERSPENLRIMDVGCGTGQQLAANRAGLPRATVVGLDRYSGMLRHAKARNTGVHLLQGDGPALPFAGETFDYVSNQYSYHHVGRTDAFVREVFRILRPGGRFVIMNMDPWSMDDWICYRYFPTTRDVDHRDFVPAERLVELFAVARFVDVSVEREHKRGTRTLREMLAWSRLRNTTSQLIAISDEEFAAGLARVEHDFAADPDGSAETENCRIVLRGDKPAG